MFYGLKVAVSDLYFVRINVKELYILTAITDVEFGQ